MPDKEPAQYERWDITPPDLPPRSRLYPLEPIGIGTPLVESLTGYIARLAEAHCVSAGTLYSKEIDALMGKGNIFTFRVEEGAGYSTHTINGRGVPAVDFVRALESLTHHRGLRYLTLLPWAEVLPVQGGLQRRARTWCPQCLRAWHADAKPVYEPLLWTLKPVTLCPLHQRPLCLACPSCKRQNGPLDSRTRPGYCSRCGRWLASMMADSLSEKHASTHDELKWGDWVATVLGELLAAAPRLSSLPARESIALVVNLCVERMADGNASAFARLVPAGRGEVRKWQTGKALPKFPVLLSLSYRLGISLLDLLSGALPFTPLEFVRLLPSQISEKQFTWQKQKPRKTLHRIKPVDVQALQAALNESPPPSVTQVVKRTIHHKSIIYRHFPKLCHVIARRFADYQKVRAVARRDRAREEVREAAYQLYARGVKITRKHLLPLLTSSDYLNLKEGRAALHQVRQELNRAG